MQGLTLHDVTVADDLERLVPGLRFHSLGGLCPVQGTGTLRGEPFYFRFRGDHAQLDVGPLGEYDIPDPPRLRATWPGVTGEPLAGSLTDWQLTLVFLTLVRELVPPGEPRPDAEPAVDAEFIALLGQSLVRNRDVLIRLAAHAGTPRRPD